ncbi:hypothetical protein F4859DRAFT_112653 [Xylaria cf. heliscus]|nr:hypothetical protein F4859DRAFT_112653 [Xylaria cf. heliscus]
MAVTLYQSVFGVLHAGFEMNHISNFAVCHRRTIHDNKRWPMDMERMYCAPAMQGTRITRLRLCDIAELQPTDRGNVFISCWGYTVVLYRWFQCDWRVRRAELVWLVCVLRAAPYIVCVSSSAPYFVLLCSGYLHLTNSSSVIFFMFSVQVGYSILYVVLVTPGDSRNRGMDGNAS